MVCCRHSIEAFQPPSRTVGKELGSDALKTPSDTTLPNIVRPNYNDLRSADAAVEANDDADNVGCEQQGASQVCMTLC